MALYQGLDGAIINPMSAAMMGAFKSYRALLGLDDQCQEYMTYMENLKEAAPAKAAPAAAPAEDDYFATARLSRKQARDNAISMLKEAEADENAQQSVLNEASQTLQVLAAYTVAESQIESLVTAKGYADCVVFMGAESVSVVVAPPEGGLTATDAARIKDIVISETDYTAEQIKIMEAN